MERACFDYIIIEDSSNVPYTYKGSHDTYLQVCRQRAQARSRRAGALSRAGDQAPRSRADAVGVGISAVPAGAAGQLARSRHRRPHRLELRHRQQRRRGAELRPRQAPAARRALRHRRRVRRRRHPAVGGVGARRRRARPRQADVRRRQQGPSDQPRGQVLPLPRADQRAALAAGPRADLPGRRLAARPAASPRAGPTRSSPRAAAASTA